MNRKLNLSFSLVLAVALLLAACGRTPTPDGVLASSAVALGTAIFADDASNNDYFGTSLAMEGDTLLIGAPDHDHGGVQSGAVYVFANGAGGWVQPAMDGELLEPTPVAGADFGASVALLGDIAAIGAPGSQEVHTFARVGSAWVHQATLTPSAGGQGFGRSVALADDLLVVGADLDDDAGANAGAVYVFEFTGAVWVETDKLTGSLSGGGERVGYAVDVDGQRIAAGAVFGDTVYVFEQAGAAWVETALSGPASVEFGVDVAITGDTLLVGAPEDDHAGPTASGTVYVFSHDGAVWNPQRAVTASDAEQDAQFGSSVAIDGDHAVFGAIFDDESGSAAGAAYVFRNRAAGWREAEKLYANGTHWFGADVAVSGGWAVIGAPRDPTVGSNAGAAYPIEFP